MKTLLLRSNLTAAAARTSKITFALMAFSFLAFAIPASAQDETPTTVTVQNRSGDLPFSSSIGTDIEHVDVSSGNLILHIPFTSIKGRGMNFNFGLNYDARFWVVGTRKLPGQPQTQVWNLAMGNYVPDATTGLGWQPTQSRLTWTNSKVSCSVGDPTLVARFQQHFIFSDADGGKHTLGVRSGTGSCDSGSWTMTADLQGPDLSGAGMFAKIPMLTKTPAIYEANGTQVSWPATATIGVPPPSRLYQGNQKLLGVSEDTNGNTLQEYAGGLDTLGRTIVTQASGTNQVLYKIYDSSGTLQTYTVNYGSISLSTAFGASDYLGAIQEATGTRNVITSIVLPNGRSYAFQYETGSYGGLTRVDLPTGAYVTFTWGNVVAGDETFRYVTSRTVHVNSQSFTWNFSFASPCASVCIDTVTDPLGNQSVYTASNGAITSAAIYSGTATGTPLRKYDLTYATYYYSYDSDEDALKLPTVITTTLEGSLVSKKEFDYDTVNFSSSVCDDTDPEDDCVVDQNTGLLLTNTEASSRGNVTEMREFDWGTGAPGALLRRTKNAYLHDSNSSYLNANIVDKIVTQNICNGTVSCAGTGDQTAQTQYDYDTYSAGSSLVAATGAAEHDDTNYGTAFTLRGNLTHVKRWRNTDGALLPTAYAYDTTGNIRSITDPLTHTTSFAYTDSFANTACAPPAGNTGQAWVSTVTNPLGQQLKVTRYPCTALVQAHKDQNDINAGRVGTTYTYDLLGRITAKNLPDGGQTSTSYNDVPPVSVTTTTKINTTTNLVSTIIKDGLGRTTQSQLTSDPQGTDYTDTTYDALGRTFTVSNPYRAGTDITTTTGITTYFYDALGRKCLDVPPDGTLPTGGACPATQPANDLFTTYSGNTTTVTDQTNKSRESVTDGLGRLTQVFEDPGSSPHLNYETDYAYDPLGNLLTVNQKGGSANSANWRSRTFTYDSLSHLLTANNPETGQITYSYNNDGMAISKTDARGMTTNYNPSESPIDTVHRVTKISYSNGDAPTIHTYDVGTCLGLSTCDNVGHLTSRTDASGSEGWSYQIDAVNHRTVHVNQRTTNGITKTSTYYLDLSGNISQAVYPTGRTVNYTFDAANRPSSVADAVNGITYATGFKTTPGSTCIANVTCYTPQGTFYALSTGQTASFTGLNLTHSYNARLQPLEFKASSTAGNAIDITYNFVDPITTHNAGHVSAITNNLDATRSQIFTYDQLNRITSALTTSTHATSPTHCWGETYGLDPWGNLNSIAATTNSNYTGCSQESGFTATADGNNHLPSFSYDASGNTQNDGTNAYTWNAESQLKTAAGVTYTYDGEGRRTSKVGSKLYWYGSGSEILAETDAGGNTQNEFIFFAGKRIAVIPFSGTPPVPGNPSYYVEDLLGTSRLITTNTGAVCYDSDFYPFGGERSYTNTCPQNYKFEGKERDTETGNDDFGARYYSGRFGRWLSADWSAVPVPVPYANLSNPQTLNLYAMVTDDPESFADLDGHECFDDGSCNSLRNPLSADHWVINGLSNTLSDFLSLDTVAHGAKAAGDSDLPTEERVKGAAKVVAVTVVNTVGGELLGPGISKVVGAVGSKLAPETTEALTKLLTPKEANIAKAESIVSEYSDRGLRTSAGKAEKSIARHEKLLEDAPAEQQRGIADDIRKAKERLEAIRREQARRLKANERK